MPANHDLPFAEQPNTIIDPLALEVCEDMFGAEVDAILTPAEKVDNLLQAAAEDFAESRNTWRDVRTAENVYGKKVEETMWNIAKIAPLLPGAHVAQSSRQIRRKTDRDIGASRQGIISFLRNDAEGTYAQFAESNGSLPKPDKRAAFIHFMAERYGATDLASARTDSLAAREELVRRNNDNGVKRSFLAARFADDSALSKITEILEQDELVPAFVERIIELSVNEKDGTPSELPGFLEVLATHVKREGSNNVLRKAFDRTALTPAECALGFVRSLFESENGQDSSRARQLSKGLRVGVNMLRLLADNLIAEERLAEDEFQNIIAGQMGAWPEALRTDLEQHAANRNQQAWGDILSTLSPFIRMGRLPATGSSVRLASDKSRRGARKAFGPETREYAAARKAIDLDDVVEPERERRAIEKVTYFKGTAGAQDRFRLEGIESIEQLLEQDRIADYIAKHQSDPTLAPAVERAIGHLLSEPLDASVTKRLANSKFLLEQDSSRGAFRRARIMELGALIDNPGLITRRSRLIYAVAPFDGKNSVAVYGIIPASVNPGSITSLKSF